MTKIELHILQNFAPSNLNRDDTGAPKDCEFGGHRRARISSQCFKRAIREAFKVGGDFEPTTLAARTKRIVQQVAEFLQQKGHSSDESIAVAVAAIAGAGLGVKSAEEDYKTEYLLFLPRRCIEKVADILHDNWEAIRAVVAGAKDKSADDEKTKKKASKAQAKGEFPKELGKQLHTVLMDASKTPDLALFGRMIADEPSANVEAACQVAQAISTNRMSMDFDFFTAVDDLRGRETAGSDMMGTVQFSSACFYRYLVVDCEALQKNLGEPDMVEGCVRGFLGAAFAAIPTGKQNSMAAHNPPSYVLSVVRKAGAPVSLANAFLQPAKPADGRDLVDASIAAIENYRGLVGRMGASRGVVKTLSVADRDLAHVDGIQRAKNVDELIDAIIETAALPASKEGKGA